MQASKSPLAVVPVIYLAGGMRSNWQDKVIEAVGHRAICVDPRRHGSKEEREYTAWDLAGVEAAHIVFGYIEKDNPCGAGLAVEFGYAFAKGKTLVYAEQPEFKLSRYFGMVRSMTPPNNAFSGTHCFENSIARLLQVIDAMQPA